MIVRRARTCILAAVAGATALAGAAPAGAKDSVPSRAAARAYFVRTFPKAAPSALLQDERGARFRTARLRVVPARRCARTRRQVECRFRVRLAPRRKQRYAPIRCHGELWAKRRDGRLVARVGDYVCR
jgi:hypothetical protein